MTNACWSSAEDDALNGLPLAAQVLYLRGLRRHMDYGTGIVGQTRRISWQMLREVLYTEPHQGLDDSGMPSLAKVRRLMVWLVKTGLAEDIGSKRHGDAIVFFLPLAIKDESAQKKPGKNPARTRQSKPGKEAGIENEAVSRSIADFPEKTRQETRQEGNSEKSEYSAKPGTHPLSGIRKEQRHTSPSGDVPQCPHQKIIELYHEILPKNPRVRDWTAARQRTLQARWREEPKRQSLDAWRQFFGYIAAECPFLTGDEHSGKPFLPNLEWLITQRNFVAIRERKYERRTAA
jgi:hypothetical protein